jgi:phage antirepressor YoqD-like protein
MSENLHLSSIKIEDYKGLFKVPFYIKEGAVYLLVTKIAEPFGKKIPDWTKHDQAKEIIAAVSRSTGILSEDLVKSVIGGKMEYRGTWMHEDIALPLAQWLDPDFYVWCNSRIRELLHYGITAIKPEELLDNPENTIMLLQEIIKERKRTAELAKENAEKERQNIALAEINKQQEDLIAVAEPKVKYHDEVLLTPDLIPVTVIAKELNMTAPKLNHVLFLLHVQYRVNKLWVLYKEHMNKGWTGNHTIIRRDSLRKVTSSSMHMLWTQAGKKAVMEMVQIFQKNQKLNF